MFAEIDPQSSYFSGFVSAKKTHNSPLAAAATVASGMKPMCAPKCSNKIRWRRRGGGIGGVKVSCRLHGSS
jgi:hypothetical protein